MSKDELLALAERWRDTILKLDDARKSTVYGGLSPFAIFGPARVDLGKANFIQTFIPEGGMGLMVRLTPKGRKTAAALKARAHKEEAS
jgi:hypothetical protein